MWPSDDTRAYIVYKPINMRKILFGFLIIACVASCQTKLGGGKIELSGEEFFVEKQGGEVSIITSGVVHCDIAEPDNLNDWIPLELFLSDPVTYEGEWYTFRSEDHGKRLTLNFDENTSGQKRILRLTMSEGDLYGSVRITLYGK